MCHFSDEDRSWSGTDVQRGNRISLGFFTAVANELATRKTNVQERCGVSHCPSVLVFTSRCLHRASRGAVCDSRVCVSDSMMLIICPPAERGRGEAAMWTETEMDGRRA